MGLETHMGKALVVIRYCGLGLLGWVFPRILVGMGVPLERWAEYIGAYFSSTTSMIQADLVLNIFGIIFAIFLVTQRSLTVLRLFLP